MWLFRTFIFSRLTVVEYVRSGRILAELLAIVPMMMFLSPQGATGVSATQFFTITSFFVLVQASFTTFMIMGLGKRPEGFLIMVRPIGRSGFLVGLFLASLMVTIIVYILLTGITVGLSMLAQQEPGMTYVSWLHGTLPLMLDASIMAAFFTLIAPVVSTAWSRLIVIGLIGIALSKNAFALVKLDMGPALLTIQTVLSIPLIPLLGGLSVAIQANLDEIALRIMLGQIALIVVLLGLALVIFNRRDLILNS